MTETSNFRASRRWVPTPFQVRRGRMAVWNIFNNPANLPLRNFSMRAGKSPYVLVRDVRRRRLLGLFFGKRGPHIPAWQLETMPRRLTERILRDARGVDEWTLYYALAEPNEALSGKTPIQEVKADNLEQILNLILTQLGIHR